MCSSNHLINQFLGDYDSNHVIGQDHYGNPDMYQDARKRLLSGEPSLVNPISYDRFRGYCRRFEKPYKRPKVIIVDEFHVVARMLSLLVGVSLSAKRYGVAPSPENDFAICAWFDKTISDLAILADAEPDRKEKAKQMANIQHIEKVFERWRKYPAQYVAENNGSGLRIDPIDLPPYLSKQLFDADHIILMSATPDVDAIRRIIGNEPYLYKDFGAIIPSEQRPILYRPLGKKLNYETPPQVVAAWIKRQLDLHPGLNTIIHVSYAWQKKLEGFFPDFLVNTSADKDHIEKRFKKEGGVWLASGCSEGIDLPDDICRLVLIPVVWKPNFGSKMVKKRMAKHGNKIVDREVLLTFQQQCGRAARHEEDRCTIIVGDPCLPRLTNKYKAEIPSDFIKSIKWDGQL